MESVSFADISIVSCGTMSLELNFLKKEGLLDTPQILFTFPGLHQDITELEGQLVWQINKAKENFPRHTGGAVILDGIGYTDRYMEEKPEDFLEYADWMGIPIIPYPVTLDHFRSLLCDAANKLK
jgi:hypothetical protein